MRFVLLTVGCPPSIATAPLSTRMSPAAFRLTVMLLLGLSQDMESSLALGVKVAFTLMLAILWGSRAAMRDMAEMRRGWPRIERGASADRRIAATRLRQRRVGGTPVAATNISGIEFRRTMRARAAGGE